MGYGMAKVTPQQFADKWSTNLSGATAAIQSGVEGVTQAPGVAAARQKTAYTQNVAAAADKWAANVASVPLADWQSAFINKGIPRIAGGAEAAKPKMQDFANQLLPYIQSGQSRLQPRGNAAQNKNRMNQWFDHMSQFRYRKGTAA